MSKLLFPQKPIFTVELIPATTVHSLDPYVDSFLNMTASLQLGGGWSTATSTNNEVELIRAIQVLSLTLDRFSNFSRYPSFNWSIFKKDAFPKEIIKPYLQLDGRIIVLMVLFSSLCHQLPSSPWPSSSRSSLTSYCYSWSNPRPSLWPRVKQLWAKPHSKQWPTSSTKSPTP